ncbi:MAG: CoA pyrophosphatase [Veillonellaceae bacterium]|nr:CoA pyrophosphatase [Veillonellaceae bacterium]
MRKWLPAEADLRTALRYAVAVPLVRLDGAWHLLFEQRTTKLAMNPGEAAFPGGRIEAYDADPAAAALREAAEEIGTPPEIWEVLGAMPLEYTYMGRLVAPYLVRAYADGLPDIVCSPDEVAAVFTVPVAHFLATEPERVAMCAGVYPGAGFPFDRMPHYQRGWNRSELRYIYVHNYGKYTIWGLSARIIADFTELCRQPGFLASLEREAKAR